MSSYWGLVDAKIRAYDKDLPVCFINLYLKFFLDYEAKEYAEAIMLLNHRI